MSSATQRLVPHVESSSRGIVFVSVFVVAGAIWYENLPNSGRDRISSSDVRGGRCEGTVVWAGGMEENQSQRMIHLLLFGLRARRHHSGRLPVGQVHSARNECFRNLCMPPVCWSHSSPLCRCFKYRLKQRSGH